ncbi:hypothetical protein V6Z11_D01G177700 [Gossypium hirsutum]
MPRFRRRRRRIDDSGDQVWRLLGSAHAREGAILAEETLAPSRAVTGVAGSDGLLPGAS